MGNDCECGDSCPLCKECGEPKCECYCDFDEDEDENNYGENEDAW